MKSTALIIRRHELPEATDADRAGYYGRKSIDDSETIICWMFAPLIWLGLAVLAVAGWLTRSRS